MFSADRRQNQQNLIAAWKSKPGVLHHHAEWLGRSELNTKLLELPFNLLTRIWLFIESPTALLSECFIFSAIFNSYQPSGYEETESKAIMTQALKNSIDRSTDLATSHRSVDQWDAASDQWRILIAFGQLEQKKTLIMYLLGELHGCYSQVNFSREKGEDYRIPYQQAEYYLCFFKGQYACTQYNEALEVDPALKNRHMNYIAAAEKCLYK